MQAALVIARYAWMRLWRGKSYWLSVLLALAPVVLTLLPGLRAGTPAERWRDALEMAIRIVPLSAVIQLAQAVAEELEGHTVTYLWTRPIPRTALLAGKLLAALPVVLGVAVLPLLAAYVITHLVQPGAAPSSLADPGDLGAALAATALGGLAASMVAAGIGALFPRQAFVVALAYLLFLDNVLGFVPNLGYVSITHHMRALAGFEAAVGPAAAALALLILALAWLGIGIARLRTIEPTGGD
jgi:ABC-type transport system involved in multi-copper enzyme maturation permease subunit